MLGEDYANPIPVSLQKMIAAPHTISPKIKSNTISPTDDSKKRPQAIASSAIFRVDNVRNQSPNITKREEYTIRVRMKEP